MYELRQILIIMSKLEKVLMLLLLVSTNLFYGFGQNDSILLYTKPDCSNCKAVKQSLTQSGIHYIEKSLTDKEIASQMLHEIAAVGYHDKILLPVIFLNNKLYHPAYQTNKGLVTLELPSVVDSIKNKFKRGELRLSAVKQVVPSTPVATSSNNDCELNALPIYLVCVNYNTETAAVAAMNKLIANGYSFAGIVMSKNIFRVYSKIFYDPIVANNELTQAKVTFQDAYLFENK
jgi:glutaredoxin